jgi:AcrR family transcriptional regulator
MGPRLPAAARREGILRSAESLFARRGFAGVTTREIARAAGISEAMLFKVFPRKEALYRAMLERHLAEVEGAMPLADLAASDTSPERFFGAIAGTILRRMDEDPTLLRLMLYSALEGHPLAREFDRARARGLRGAIEAYLRRRLGPRAPRGVDLAVTSRSFVWLVAGFGISRALFEEPGARAIPRKVLVGRLVRGYLRGIGPVGRARRVPS